MPYSRTAAREAADQRMRDIRKPFVFAKARPRAIPTEVRDAIFQNCVFQLSAVFEDYIYQVLTSWLTRIRVSNLPAGSLSKELRLSQILVEFDKIYRDYWSDLDEGRARNQLAAKISLMLALDDSYVTPTVMPDAIFKNSKFPTERNLKRLFKRFGVDNVSNEISRRTRSDFGLNLRSFMDIRNALAHEFPPDITDLDVKKYLNWVDMWISAFDRTVYSLVCRTTGSQHWS